MQLILVLILIWVIVSLFKGDKGEVPPELKGQVRRLEKDIKRLKQQEKEAIKKGRPNEAALARTKYRELEKLIGIVRHGTPESRAMADMNRRISEAERKAKEAEERAKEAEWEAWRHRW